VHSRWRPKNVIVFLFRAAPDLRGSGLRVIILDVCFGKDAGSHCLFDDTRLFPLRMTEVFDRGAARSWMLRRVK
jgi:hypothetical protein